MATNTQKSDALDPLLDKKLMGKDKKLKAQIKSAVYLKKKSEKHLKVQRFLENERGGFLQPEENEQTLKFRQNDLKPLLPIQNLHNIFDLKLDFGPYSIDYTRNGQILGIAGQRGHCAIFDWKTKTLKCEFHVKETIRDIKFLLDENLYALAQKKYVFIYDMNGIEVHRLKNHVEPMHLEFLPYHYLLVSASRLGFLKYQDVSTGAVVVEYQTKIKEPSDMKQNPYNGIMCVADKRGVVSMFSPNTSQPLVKMLCHKSAVLSLAIQRDGHYMVTTGNDGLMKVWDLRTYKKIYDYWTPKQAKTIDISQRNLLAVSNGNLLMVWKDWYLEKQKIPYMKQEMFENNYINDLKFSPYEDFLGVGLENGFSSLIVPGAGEANFDTFEVNIFQTNKQKKEHLVKSLLEKLPASTITLNPNIIGNIDEASKEIIQAEKEQENKELEAKKLKKKKKKMRGRSKTSKETKTKESVYDQKTRERIKAKVDNRIKVRKAEKEKVKREMSLLDNLNELVDNEPAKLIKKIKK